MKRIILIMLSITICLGVFVLSYVLTTLKTDRNSSLSDRPALPLVA